MSLCTTRKRGVPGVVVETDLNRSAFANIESPRAMKRQRTRSPERELLTPPNGLVEEESSPKRFHDDDEALDVLQHATNVLAIEAAALANITDLYRKNAIARNGLLSAVKAVVETQQRRGKLVVTGVGKSAYIAQKFVASCKSLGIAASFMHACEAVHGDLGDIREDDILLFVSFSGKTPELLNLLPHIPATTRLMALSSHSHPSTCPLLANAAATTSILLPTPIPEPEAVSFGVSAPTTSTTVTLAVADMLALTIAEQLHRSRKGDVFARNHPGGAIGMTHREVEVEGLGKGNAEAGKLEVLELPSPSISGSDDA